MERSFCEQLQIKGSRLFESIENAKPNESTFLHSWRPDFLAHLDALQQQITDISIADGAPAATFDEFQKAGQTLCNEIDELQKLSDAGLWIEEQELATGKLTQKIVSLRKMAVAMMINQTATKEDMIQMKAEANALRKSIEEAQDAKDPGDFMRDLQNIAGQARTIGDIARYNH
jgi:hypothetical protein